MLKREENDSRNNPLSSKTFLEYVNITEEMWKLCLHLKLGVSCTENSEQQCNCYSTHTDY